MHVGTRRMHASACQKHAPLIIERVYNVRICERVAIIGHELTCGSDWYACHINHLIHTQSGLDFQRQRENKSAKRIFVLLN